MECDYNYGDPGWNLGLGGTGRPRVGSGRVLRACGITGDGNTSIFGVARPRTHTLARPRGRPRVPTHALDGLEASLNSFAKNNFRSQITFGHDFPRFWLP